MIVEVRGTGTMNKGAQYMLRARLELDQTPKLGHRAPRMSAALGGMRGVARAQIAEQLRNAL